MSGNRLLLDTNIVLYLLNGDETLATFLFEKQLFISIISEMELLAFKNISLQEQKQIKAFLNELIILNISNEIKENTIDIKRKSSLKLPDAIIAATSSSQNIPLITADKQFKNLEALDIIFYEHSN